MTGSWAPSRVAAAALHDEHFNAALICWQALINMEAETLAELTEGN